MCPIVGASVGQHYRHSMDHLELAALVTASASSSIFASTKTIGEKDVQGKLRSLLSPHPPSPITLHYDLRVRGGTMETDLDLTRTRIQSVWNALQDISDDNDNLDQCNINTSEKISTDIVMVGSQPVNASFLLTSDTTNDKDLDNNHLELSSSIGRELGFVAHHAIHHMAMVKIIAVETIGLDVRDLPRDFGRAPSTIQHDNDKTSPRHVGGSNNSNG